jgi:hypothetical protein
MQENDSKALEDNLDMVNYIMLHRIYDVLLMISNKLVGPEETEKMSKYHEEGYLLGPSPSFRSEDAV